MAFRGVWGPAGPSEKTDTSKPDPREASGSILMNPTRATKINPTRSPTGKKTLPRARNLHSKNPGSSSGAASGPNISRQAVCCLGEQQNRRYGLGSLALGQTKFELTVGMLKGNILKIARTAVQRIPPRPEKKKVLFRTSKHTDTPHHGRHSSCCVLVKMKKLLEGPRLPGVSCRNAHT